MDERQKFVTEQIRNLELINRVDRKSFLDLFINEFRSKFMGFLKNAIYHDRMGDGSIYTTARFVGIEDIEVTVEYLPGNEDHLFAYKESEILDLSYLDLLRELADFGNIRVNDSIGALARQMAGDFEHNVKG
jgi:hypothetical protein